MRSKGRAPLRAAQYVGDRDRSGQNASNRSNPRTGQVQIEVAYTGLCGTDLHILHGNMDARVERPLVFGHEMSGTIAAVGAGVTGWIGRRRRHRHAARLGRHLPRLPRRATSTSART